MYSPIRGEELKALSQKLAVCFEEDTEVGRNKQNTEDTVKYLFKAKLAGSSDPWSSIFSMNLCFTTNFIICEGIRSSEDIAMSSPRHKDVFFNLFISEIEKFSKMYNKSRVCLHTNEEAFLEPMFDLGISVVVIKERPHSFKYRGLMEINSAGRGNS